MKSFLFSLLKWFGGVLGASIAGVIAIWVTTQYTLDQVIKVSGPALSSFAQAVLNELTWTNFAAVASMLAGFLSYKYRHKFPSYKVSIAIERVPTPQPTIKAPKETATPTQQPQGVSKDVAAMAAEMLESLTKPVPAPRKSYPVTKHWMSQVSAEDKALRMYGRMSATEMTVPEMASILGITHTTAQRVASNLHAAGLMHSYHSDNGKRMLKLTQLGVQEIQRLREEEKRDPRGSHEE